MKYKQTATRFARTALALGSTALAVTCFNGVSNAEDSAPAKPRQPVPSAEVSSTASSSYWTGEYWDAQKGSSFWHNLTSDRSEATNQTDNNAANGSKRVRDLQRARARAAAKPER